MHIIGSSFMDGMCARHANPNALIVLYLTFALLRIKQLNLFGSHKGHRDFQRGHEGHVVSVNFVLLCGLCVKKNDQRLYCISF